MGVSTRNSLVDRLLTWPDACRHKIDVDKLSLRELDSLLTIAERRKKLLSSRRPVAVVRRELIALAVFHGYTIEELIGITPASAADKPAQRDRKSTRLNSSH